MVIDMLTICHQKPSMHPSPRWMARHLEHWSERAVRADIANLIACGLIVDVQPGVGSAPARYKLLHCTCPHCKATDDN